MRRRTILAIWALALVASAPRGGAPARAQTPPPGPAEAPAPTVDSLMARFRAIPGLSASFREEKRIALLARPLVSEGTVHYTPPGRLARHTLTPFVSSVLLEQGTLRFGDGATEERVDLGASPALRALVESFVQLLAGDRAALERTFTLELRPAAGDAWELGLRPRSAPLSHVIREMTFAGDGKGLTRMRILEASGDEALTTFTAVNTQRRYSPAEIQQIFRLPKK